MSSTLYVEDTFDNKDNEPLVPSETELQEFKQQVSEWIKLDDQIRKLNIAIKERKTHQKALEKKVSLFMRSYKYDNLNTQQGQIKCNIRMVHQPIKLSTIKTTILDNNIDPNEIITGLRNLFIADNRPKVQKQSLRRIMPKVSMSLDL